MIDSTDRTAIEYLLKGILTLQTEEEAENFLNDLCTVTEITSMAQRLQVARMLYSSRVYTDIVEETGASTATISRVNRTLNDGRNISGKGYRVVLDRMGEVPAEKHKRGSRR